MSLFDAIVNYTGGEWEMRSLEVAPRCQGCRPSGTRLDGWGTPEIVGTAHCYTEIPDRDCDCDRDPHYLSMLRVMELISSNRILVLGDPRSDDATRCR